MSSQGAYHHLCSGGAKGRVGGLHGFDLQQPTLSLAARRCVFNPTDASPLLPLLLRLLSAEQAYLGPQGTALATVFRAALDLRTAFETLLLHPPADEGADEANLQVGVILESVGRAQRTPAHMDEAG